MVSNDDATTKGERDWNFLLLMDTERQRLVFTLNSHFLITRKSVVATSSGTHNQPIMARSLTDGHGVDWPAEGNGFASSSAGSGAPTITTRRNVSTGLSGAHCVCNYRCNKKSSQEEMEGTRRNRWLDYRQNTCCWTGSLSEWKTKMTQTLCFSLWSRQSKDNRLIYWQ